MPTVTHPCDREDVAGHLPDVVTVGGDNYVVADDGTVDLPSDTAVRELARAYDLEPADLLGTDAETCDVVKTDGEVCGREKPCPYHD
jgi:hypothetical protein